MDIDLVVLWVDGNDSEHIKMLNKYKNMQDLTKNFYLRVFNQI